MTTTIPRASAFLDNTPHDHYSAVMVTLDGRTVDLTLSEARDLLDELNAAVKSMEVNMPIPYLPVA